jgi:hypothetical protein
MIEFREAVLNAVLGAGQVKGMGPEWLVARQHGPNLCNAPTTVGRRKLEPVIREHGMDVVRQPFNEAP